MKRKARKVNAPGVLLHAEFQHAEAAEADERTFDVVAYTGAEVPRYPLFDEPYLLSMKVDAKSVRLGRFSGGAAVVKNHDTWSIDDVVGATQAPRIENGLLKVQVRFGTDAESEAVRQRVLDGTLKHVSVGVNFFELTELEPDPDTGMARIQATDWEPNHLGIVAVPADPGAGFATFSAEHAHDCIFHRADGAHKKENTMDETIKVRLLADCDDGKLGEIVEILEADFDEALHSKELEKPKRPPAKRQDPDGMAREVDEVLAADRKYQEQIRRIAKGFGLDDLWAQRQINLAATVEEASADATKQRAKNAPQQSNDIGFGEDFESPVFKRETMADALVARAKREKPSEAARQYVGMSMADLALQCLALRGEGRGLDARNHTARILSAELALHVNADFPKLLANALNKILLPEYEAAQPTYRQLGIERPFNDFRAHNFDRAGDFPNLAQVNEHQEFTYGTMGENQEQVTAVTYGRILGLSRQMLINDDLSAFANLAMKAGRRVADFENATFFSVCIAPNSGTGPALSDAVVVFHSTHANVTGGGALSNSLLESAYGLMMAQTSIDGLKLNVMPRIVLTSPTSYGLARRLTSETNPADAADINTFAGMIRPLADANLSGTRFYVLADPAQVPNFVYGYVQGGGPRTETRPGFEIDGVELKVALDFGCGAIDYRGGVSGAGS